MIITSLVFLLSTSTPYFLPSASICALVSLLKLALVTLATLGSTVFVTAFFGASALTTFLGAGAVLTSTTLVGAGDVKNDAIHLNIPIL